MKPNRTKSSAQTVWEDLQLDLQKRIQKKKDELQESELLIQQSKIELDKLTKRNTSVTSELQKFQTKNEIATRAEIITAYDGALDAQQRLFLLRGRLEKIQGERQQIINSIEDLSSVLKLIEDQQIASATGVAAFNTLDTVEMIIQAQESERQRLSRQMHDGPAQSLSNFILQTEIAMRLFDIDQVKAKEELGSLKDSATQSFQKIRDFIFELRPMMLDDLGLIPTVRRYVDAYHSIPGVSLNLVVSGMERRLESYLEVMIFRSIQELLGNALRHSQANLIKIQIDMGDSKVKVLVEDNGKGFDPTIIEQRNSMGLKVIRDRVGMLGGTFFVESNSDNGTRIGIEIPTLETNDIS